VPKVATQWNSGTTRESNRGPWVRIPSALTTKPLSHTNHEAIHLFICLSVCLSVLYRLVTQNQRCRRIKTGVKTVNVPQDRSNQCASCELKGSEVVIWVRVVPYSVSLGGWLHSMLPLDWHVFLVYWATIVCFDSCSLSETNWQEMFILAADSIVRDSKRNLQIFFAALQLY